MKTLKTVLAILVSVVVLSSCSKDEDQPMPVGPELSYSETSFNISLREPGNSGLPTLKWNGEIGSISLASNIQGVEVNSSNGVVTWDESLPVGTSEFQVVATNSVGQKSVTLQITNEFKGEFEGGANNNPASTMLSINGLHFEYKSDGTLTYSKGVVTGSGTWSRDGNTFTTHFTSSVSPIVITMVGELSNGLYAAQLSGFYYHGFSTTPGTEVGYFRIKMSQI